MSQPNPIEREGAAKEDAQRMFDTISDFGNRYASLLPDDVIEAMDNFANYCGDIAKGREYKPDEPKTELPDLDGVFDKYRAEIIEGLKSGLKYPDVASDAEARAKAVVESLLNKARLESALEEAKLGLAISGKYEHRQHFKARIKILGDELARLKSKGASE
jgi:hypothetical protein